MKVVVTGGAGFFGAWIAKQLLDAGDEVVVVDAGSPGSAWAAVLSQAERDRVTWVNGRVDEPAFITTLVDAAPDAVIHLAGLQIPTCRNDPVLGARVNLIGTLNVFEAAKKAAKPFNIVYASSAAIYGPDEDYHREAVSETSAPAPASHYGAFKLCCEHSARAYHIANGISSIGLRPLSVYGPGRDAGLTSFPSRAIAAAVAGVPFEIPYSGPTCYVHVREVRASVGAARQWSARLSLAVTRLPLPVLPPTALCTHSRCRWRTSS